jgi:xylulokinase
VHRLLLIGGGARSDAVRRIAPAVLGMDVTVPEAGEYVADGAARQAAWAASGADQPPTWGSGLEATTYSAEAVTAVREQYADVRELTATRTPSP